MFQENRIRAEFLKKIGLCELEFSYVGPSNKDSFDVYSPMACCHHKTGWLEWIFDSIWHVPKGTTSFFVQSARYFLLKCECN